MEQKSWLTNKVNGVFFLTPPASSFEAAYTTVRAKELRLLTDEEVLLLPESSRNPMEWKLRQWTLSRFEGYIKKKRPKRILDIGCGNGWFTARLQNFGEEVYGLDVGQYELEQSARCFSSKGPSFICCTNWELLPENYFDCITFNGSIQYFKLDTDFWQSIYRILNPNGEIHLLDSPFYTLEERKAAQQRTLSYYRQVGVPEAAAHYHHLIWTDLPNTKKIRYKPNRIIRKLFPGRSPFPWITIYKPL